MNQDILAAELLEESASRRGNYFILGYALAAAVMALLIAAGGMAMPWATARLIQLNVKQIPASSSGERTRFTHCLDQLVRASGGSLPLDVVSVVSARRNCENTLLQLENERSSVWLGRMAETQTQVRTLRLTNSLLALIAAIVTTALLSLLIRSVRSQHQMFRHFIAARKRWSSAIVVLQDHDREMKLRSDARDQLQMCVTVKDACDVMVQFVSTLLDGTSGAMCMIDNSRQMLEVQCVWGSNSDIRDVFPMDSCCCLRTGQIRWRDSRASVVNCGHFAATPPHRYVCLPLIADSDTLGILYVDCGSDEAMGTVERSLGQLCALLQLSSVSIAALRLRGRLENQSIRDDLTGLFNRRFMEIALEREIHRASRKESSLAVFMIDVDHFKWFNDTYGHQAGDTVLREIADRFLLTVRGEDVVCRYGGEEFVMILPDIQANKAVERAESIRKAIADLRVTNHSQSLGPITISIGVAIYPEDGREAEPLLQAADRRLYDAKKNGRNQVVFTLPIAKMPSCVL